MGNKSYWNTFDVPFMPRDYKQTIQMWEEQRKELPYLLDGVVISFPIRHRATLGQNSHDPEWAIAIKFVPVETITEVEGIEWNISKRGEIIPTMLLKPVFLDGSTVRRASGYNAGYVLGKKLGTGARVSIAKAGDIIPEIQKVVVPSKSNVWQSFPTNCPHCNSELSYDTVHLHCPNENCQGRVAKQLSGAVKVLDIKNVGEKTIEPFAKDFKNIYEVMVWVYTYGMTPDIEKYGMKYNSRSHQIFTKAFLNVKSLTYEKVIQMLGYDNVGKKISEQLALEHAGLEYNYAHLEKALVAKLRSDKISNYIKKVVAVLESWNVTIDRPKPLQSKEGLGIVMTGSPKAFGFTTKAEFLAKNPQLYETKLNAPDCKYLVTDDLGSTSSKMKQAEKKGIEITLYKQF